MTNKITKYILESDSDFMRFKQSINRYLQEGWELYGHTTMSSVGDKDEIYLIVAHALVKYE